MSGRHLNMFVDFDEFVILSLAVVCEQKMEAPASMSCRQALTFGSPGRRYQTAL